MAWRDTFKNVTLKDIRTGKLRVPSARTDENIELVMVEFNDLRHRICGWYDENVEYIDNGRQYREAVAYNEEINAVVKLLDEKLKKWLEG